MKETPKNGLGLSFRMNHSAGVGTFPVILGVAGRHRAYPSVSLDKLPYLIVLLLRLNTTTFY